MEVIFDIVPFELELNLLEFLISRISNDLMLILVPSIKEGTIIKFVNKTSFDK